MLRTQLVRPIEKTWTVVTMALVLAPAALAAPLSFYDDFNSPSLQPEWSVTDGAGSYSLSARPGFLRYSLEESTHPNGDNPATKLTRPFDGTQWLFEMKVDYSLASGNGRQLFTRIFFGPSAMIAESQIIWFRSKDDAGGGPVTGVDAVGTRDGGTDGPGLQAIPLLPDTHYVRIVRDDQDVSVLRSADGLSWLPFFNHTFAAPLGSSQVLQFSGAQFVSGQQGMADYDYVQLTGVPEPSTFLGIAGGLGILAIRLCRTRGLS